MVGILGMAAVIPRTLIPEPFTLKRETEAKGEESKNQGTGYGVQCLPLTKDSPLPFPDSGMLLRGETIPDLMLGKRGPVYRRQQFSALHFGIAKFDR